MWSRVLTLGRDGGGWKEQGSQQVGCGVHGAGAGSRVPPHSPLVSTELTCPHHRHHHHHHPPTASFTRNTGSQVSFVNV